MKKILYLSPGCFDKGGISRYNRYQIRAIREISGKNNVRVYSLLGPKAGDFEEQFKVTWHGWGATTPSKLAFTLKVLFALLFWKPDIIWLGHINLTEILVRFNLFTKVKSVLNIYGLEVWSGLRPNVERGFKKVTHVISDCHFTAKYAEDEGFRPRGTVEVIWDCVDLEKFTAEGAADNNFYEHYKLPNPIEHPWILSLGRLSFTAAHKGYERLIEVFAKVVKGDARSVLVFAGKGDMIDFLKKLAEKYNVLNRVYFSGMVHEEDLPKFYRASRVFSLVSDRGKGRGEGIPLTPLEAMACGSPIIVGNQDGSQEAIFESKNGYCISPHDLDGHAKAISAILNNQDEFEHKSKSAITIAHQYFSFQEFKSKHQTFLLKI
ncbi:glycosyltransferase family 4 protein [Subsaximicrobium wynnwilliamsii]|uniref:Glycosyltransferase family 4 protein n=1 Tax=Subsaximicrobium wynnwilliamsii TaxID=291179 RepID=A0A5C6ZG53_9FLAO|nr:glycosyltransferase family 4 protein [Subsaximicrobium wynnwilliamsii]TXD81372.1 glycosyltransferase family 4 protein [Subsaximicrobium wynnwilliamsii]TXD89068.1 glycosyltransferase family 4 protein [Subsaximicrobium wynnwilliamsii]TXE00746.1 glycosyltransferase family 4 protein [Subsaximicrobium wynnwilliamsii]